MDPCPFARLIIESLALQLPMGAKPSAGAGVHPSATPCYCKITLKGFPSQTALLPLSSRGDVTSSLESATCAQGAEAKSITFHSGWMRLGKDDSKRVEKLNPAHAKLHLVVRSEPDPRFVFQFGGEPECSPVVYQIQGNIRQPVFSCKFSADRNSRSRSLPPNFAISNNNSSKKWMVRSLSGEKEKPVRERKGWMIMIYDLSGSPVAAASVITPFVPSPGSDRVSRSNPGAWLILRPHGSHVSSWKPWGRLEAWRERGPVDGLGYKFELVTENGPTRTGIPIAEATLNIKKGGQFCIDKREAIHGEEVMRSPVRGFVMGSTVEGEGKASKPLVQVGMQHVTCMADAALFVALSAAIDLSMDACRLFSQKLRKELCYDDQHDHFS
ncbi:Lysophospholipase-like protein 1 [Bienertia sinuspersici]